ncbi:hypothetical protein A7K93_10905 [Candidatus Methylacidiphilum fumarolicum]|nr:hypothetical protein A7K73_01070 [Candidatus Methylacidiphilum fumarolicum]TFE71408.1 hypothetical protein A7K93_10905 [Candidatus Methylacidiphilum fumarolicum]TFE73089.1 hypothetical protein A7K72_07350 [Candidatus Methylacidiphilum fumarolicum]TFE77061.1 hypothetical protein A7D33_06785 [Candidatus Methylacidiphilum fumarolicum]
MLLSFFFLFLPRFLPICIHKNTILLPFSNLLKAHLNPFSIFFNDKVQAFFNFLVPFLEKK